jgi:7-carboxy-7-deazaguanine synthase
MTIQTTQYRAAYPVMEHFYTLQGEGAYSGQAAYFIRLGGCDVGCVWCDVKESWDAAAHPTMTTQTMMQLVQAHPGNIVVVTGGEPSMYDLRPITQALHAAGKRTHIETSASHVLTGDWDWVTISPKKFKPPLVENMALADELKIVVFNQHDFKWAEEYASLVKPGCKLYLQPEWDKRSIVTPLIIDYIQQHPRWQLSLQTHKYLNIP